MKLGIVVGHTNADKGAASPSLGQQEYTWNSDLAARIERLTSPVARKTFFRDGGGIAGAYAASDGWGSDITVELHFTRRTARTPPAPASSITPARPAGASWPACSSPGSTPPSAWVPGPAAPAAWSRRSRPRASRCADRGRSAPAAPPPP